MANKKFTDLPVAATATLADIGAAVQVGVLSQITTQKIADLLGLGSGKIVLHNADGSATFVNGIVSIFPAGDVGSTGGTWLARQDGSGFFSSGSFNWSGIGDVSCRSIAGNTWGIGADGSGNLSGGTINFDGSGNVVLVSVSGGSWTIGADGTFNNGVAVINGVNGSANLAGGKLLFDSNGKATTYNNDVTAGSGLCSIVASVALTNQGAAIGVTNLFTPPANGTYRVSVVQQVTTSSAAGLLTTTIGWTDLVGATTAVPAAALATTATGRDDGAKTIFATGGVPITYTTTLTNITTQRYALNIIVERLS